MQHNLPLPKQMTGQNRVKLFEMFIYLYIKDCFMRSTKNDQTSRKLIYGGSHMQTGTPRLLL